MDCAEDDENIFISFWVKSDKLIKVKAFDAVKWFVFKGKVLQS